MAITINNIETMNPIYFNTENQSLDFQSFKEKMIEICNTQRKGDKALAFAFIVYNFETAQIAKVLNDATYWNALNKTSGKYLSIFSLHNEPKRKLKIIDNSFNREIMGFMTSVPIGLNYDIEDKFSEIVNKYFGSTFTITYPAILFFQVDENKIIDSILIELKEEFIEPSFLEIQTYVKKAVEGLKKIDNNDQNNYREAFDYLEKEVKKTQNFNRVKRIAKTGNAVVGFISSLFSLF
jgi:hypothetical protein